jgi:hypothetical protein
MKRPRFRLSTLCLLVLVLATEITIAIQSKRIHDLEVELSFYKGPPYLYSADEQ